MELLKKPQRAFPAQVKDTLFSRKSPCICAVCSLPIVNIEHAEVDHIVPWSKGGDTVIGNAQLLHIKCNREKGAKMMD